MDAQMASHGMPSQMSSDSVYSSFLNECQHLEADIRRFTAIAQELDVELQPLIDELDEYEPLENQIERELQSLRRSILFASTKEDVLKAELARHDNKKQENVKCEEELDEEHINLLNESRSANRAGIQETLRLARCAQDISTHYVMELNGQLEAARRDVADLTRETNELCTKMEVENLARQKALEETTHEEPEATALELDSIVQL